MHTPDEAVVVVGAGMAGLRAAIELQKHTERVVVLEQSARPGGRVKTDQKHGFLLDRGFQIFLTAYPESRSLFDYDALSLRAFMDGAIVRREEEIHELVDPVSHPEYLISAIRSDIGTWEDRWITWKLTRTLRDQSMEELLDATGQTTQAYLEELGFSDDYIEGFLRPFFSGVFLENDLQTASSLFRFLFHMFAEGKGALPSEGMQAVPNQLAHRLPEGTIQYGCEVAEVTSGRVTLSDGSRIDTSSIVVAVDGWTADALELSGAPKSNGTSCFYYAVENPPIDRPILVLNAHRDRPITNLCVPSLVQPSYSPAKQHLLSVSTVHDRGSEVEEEDVRSVLREWYGNPVMDWPLLASYDIPHALPAYPPDVEQSQSGPTEMEEGVYLAGDYRTTPSLNGALRAGRRAAEEVIRDLEG